MASVFTKIVNGELPAAKIYEDEQTLAFLDIRPAARGHALIICKEEYISILDTPPELVAAVANTAQRVAKAIEKTLKPDGFNVVQNNGADAGQTVFHYHVHVIPRWRGDKTLVEWIQTTPSEDSLNALAANLSAQMQASE